MSIYLIRHGQTQGNLEGRYIGCRTDEPLCAAGICALSERRYPAVKRVYVSPMLRCRQTAERAFPGIPQGIVPDFRECDFGTFESRNYSELNGNAAYQRWIDSGGELPFPEGESRAIFAERCVRAYKRLLPELRQEETALVVHGGTIMAIMEYAARPSGSYFDFQVRNAEGYLLNADGSFQHCTFRRED